MIFRTSLWVGYVSVSWRDTLRRPPHPNIPTKHEGFSQNPFQAYLCWGHPEVKNTAVPNLLEASARAHRRTAVPHANEVSVAKFVQTAPETNLGVDRFGFKSIVHMIESNDIVRETSVFQALQWTFLTALWKRKMCVSPQDATKIP